MESDFLTDMTEKSGGSLGFVLLTAEKYGIKEITKILKGVTYL